MTRIASFAQFQLTLGQTLNTQRQTLNTSIQVSSGQVSRNYVGIAPDAQRLLNLETAHARATQFTANNKQIDRRLETMETNIAQIFDAVSRFRTLLVNAVNVDNGQDMAIANEAANFKQEVANLLNVQQDGRYLFAGSRTDTEPVDLTGWTPPVLPLTPPLVQYAEEYYRGDQVQLTTEADEALTVSYGITADEDAFEYVLRAMHYVELSGPPADPAVLEVALALVNTALGTEQPNTALGADPITHDLADLRTLIGTSRRSIESANERLNEFTLYTEQTIGDIELIDPAEALTRLSNNQVQLEASYMVLSRLSQLTLTQFLR